MIPRYAGGRPSKLTDAQKERLVELLKQNNTWTTEEIRELIFNEFKVEYTSKQVTCLMGYLSLISKNIQNGERF